MLYNQKKIFYILTNTIFPIIGVTLPQHGHLKIEFSRDCESIQHFIVVVQNKVYITVLKLKFIYDRSKVTNILQLATYQ